MNGSWFPVLQAGFLVLDVALRIPFRKRDPVRVGGLVNSEIDAEVVADLQAGAAAEVSKRLPLLLGHMVAVGYPRIGNCLPPGLAADGMLTCAPDAVPDVVVVVNGVRGLGAGTVRIVRSLANAQQARVEQPFSAFACTSSRIASRFHTGPSRAGSWPASSSTANIRRCS